MRWVNVFRAWYRSLVMVAVCSFSPPAADHRVLSGLWFHSHSGPNAGPVNVSVPVGGLACCGGRGTFGYGYELPQVLLTVLSVGQPSEVQVIGASTGTRPPGYATWKAM